ncbi:MAG: hypothetical protein PUB13_07195 [Lachnospiraceae bacterium]|nr:hypothetical protein [Lachnospiraceae bacterium]
MKKYKKWLAVFGITVFVGLAAVAGLTIYVDPFFQYHKPLPSFPYLVDNQVSMNPGLAKNMDYDSVLLGSSMTVNFNTDWFMEEMGLTTQKLSYNGAFPKDQANIMDIIFDSKQENVKAVFLGIDELNYSADINQTKFPIPEYLYDKNYANDVKYLFNKDVLLNYIFRPAVDTKDKSDWNMIYKPWWQDEHYQKALVLMYYEPAPEAEKETPADVFLPAVKENLDVNICPYIGAHPETTFYIFYPPYSILYWNDVMREKELEAVLAKYDYMTRRLLQYDNVKLYFFQNQEDIICNLNNYADYTHYHGSICKYMVECFANGNRRVTEENLEEELDKLRQLATTYDYEAIYDDWYN